MTARWVRPTYLVRLFLIVLSSVAVACGGGVETPPPQAADPVPAADTGRDPAVLKVALLPDEDSSKVLRDNEGLERYLETHLSKDIELHVLPNYAAMIEAVRARHIDLAYFGPLSYCIAVDKGADIRAFAAKTKAGSPTYTSVVIAHAGTDIATVADLAGRSVGYGDPASTSSHLIPKGVLAEHGVAEGGYEESFLGKHDVVARTVAAGSVDAGGLSRPIFDGLVADGKIAADQVRVLAESAPIPQYPWAMQMDLASDLRDKIVEAFMDLDDPAILGPLKAEGFARIDDGDYDSIRNAAKVLGKDLAALGS